MLKWLHARPKFLFSLIFTCFWMDNAMWTALQWALHRLYLQCIWQHFRWRKSLLSNTVYICSYSRFIMPFKVLNQIRVCIVQLTTSIKFFSQVQNNIVHVKQRRNYNINILRIFISQADCSKVERITKHKITRNSK